MKSGILPVPGARLHHEVRGAGPGLLIVPTGNGDAAPFGAMADALAARHTVVTYDRRGFSRSPLDGPVDPRRRVDEDVEDARRLVEQVIGGPAYVLGTCSGGIVALGLLERHPDLVRRMVVHEPPLASVLPDAAHWSEVHADLYDVYRTSGATVAKDVFKNHMGLMETRPPKGAELPAEELAAMLERLRRNDPFWFEYELRAYPDHVLDLEALERSADRLVLAGGAASRDFFPAFPNAVLAERFGTGVEEFPGGHLGHVTHPYEFAALLTALFDTGQG